MRKYIMRILSKIYLYLEYSHRMNEYNSFREIYNIHPSFSFNGKGIIFYGDGDISIDENSYIGRHSSLQASNGSRISIAKNCKIGPFFCVWTNTANVDQIFNGKDKLVPKKGDIYIGEGVWIGAHVVISPNVRVGANSIIGANSIVTKDVPENAIVGGIPAKIIRFKTIR